MSKSARETLFGVTLTELVIILFFILLLLAIFNIEDLTSQIPEDEEDIVPASTVLDLLLPDAEIKSDLVPIELISKEILRLQKDSEELKKRLQTEKELSAEEQEETGVGDCRKGGFWITPKCADNCWSIDNPTGTRQYDYLIDIGVCDSFVVVQRSDWIQKTEIDFSQVEGAYEIVSKKEMSMSQLHQMLDVIKEPGYLLEPKQCFHNVRLIDLGSKSIETWTNNWKQVNSRVRPFVLTKTNGSLYDSVRLRFNDDVCEVEGLNDTKELLNPQVNKVVEEAELTEKEERQVLPEPVITRARMDVINFNKNFTNHRYCKNNRNSKITYDFEININSAGIAYNVKYLGEREVLNRSNKKLLDITENSLYQTSYSPGLSDGKPVSSVLRQPITLSKGVCE